MTIALLATLAFTPGPLPFSAADYFPTRPGRRLTYEEKSLMASTTTDVFEEPVEIGGVMAVPVTTLQNGQKMNTAYYRVDANVVSSLGYDKDRPLPTPMPVLKVSDTEKIKWDFAGPMSADQVAEPVVIRGEAQVLKDPREVLGKKVSVLQVKMVITVGTGKAREEVEQVSIYGKGIGLVESSSTTKIAKRKAVNTLKLTAIEEPKEGS